VTATTARRPSGVETALLMIMLLEVTLLGSGRIAQLGPLTLRMWLYVAGLGYATLVVLQRGRLHREVVLFLLGFLAITALSSLVGLLNDVPIPDLLEDVKPLLFFLSLLFFDIAIVDLRQVHRVANLVRLSAVVLAVGYLVGIALVVLRVLPFRLVYEVLSQRSEFFFRGDSGVFYKGFLYLGVGFCFFVVGGWRSKLVSGLLFATIVLTLTRGMLLTAVVVLGVSVLLERRSALGLPLYLATLAAAPVLVWPWLVRAFSDRVQSDAMRLWDVRVVEQSTTWLSLFIGHGLGTAVGQRERIEASYLEILHQQGLLGLLFWLSVAAVLTRDFVRATRAGREVMARPFFLGALFVYLESATNPYLTNPIGMSMVLLSLVVLKLLGTMPLEPLEQPALASPMEPVLGARV
jgi:hypothetical protein